MPYTDEVRFISASRPCMPPSMLPAVPRTRASSEAIAAAAALVVALSDRTIDRGTFRGVEASFANAALKTQVMGHEQPDPAAFHSTQPYLVARAKMAPVPERVAADFIEHVRPGLPLTSFPSPLCFDSVCMSARASAANAQLPTCVTAFVSHPFTCRHCYKDMPPMPAASPSGSMRCDVNADVGKGATMRVWLSSATDLVPSRFQIGACRWCAASGVMADAVPVTWHPRFLFVVTSPPLSFAGALRQPT
jgi:hypothetical protein